ncbi:ATP-binding protein, partial [Patescibacteria group bacterium]|nr:ATP-binding protein [Patescibacteria group bacterium]
MDIKKLILERIKDKGWVKSAEIIKKTGFSREYVGRFLRQLQEEGIIVMVGKANQARYVAANSRAVNKAKQLILSKRLTLQNKNLKEDLVLEQLKRETGIWLGLPGNTSAILDYGFTEMLNNAIEHSQSKKITVQISHGPGQIVFEVVDQGIGIYKNIMRRHKLDNQEQAIEELMKGKQTTMPRAHSGEGIFFCSKVADILLIQG